MLPFRRGTEGLGRFGRGFRLCVFFRRLPTAIVGMYIRDSSQVFLKVVSDVVAAKVLVGHRKSMVVL